ncbi:MAG: potassium channel family protein [Cyanobacteriota bacterium]
MVVALVAPLLTVAVVWPGGAAAGPMAGATVTGCLGPGAQVLLAVLMLTLTCCVHALVSVVQVELSQRGRLDRWCGPRSSGRLLLIVAMALLTGLALLVEILLWATLYNFLGLFPTLEASFYFSGITFTTVGYGDMTLPGCMRLLSVSEAVNGVLMAGWSTAQLITVVQRMMELRLRSEGWDQGTDRSSAGSSSR